MGKPKTVPSNFWQDVFPFFKDLQLPTYFYAGDIGAIKNTPSFYSSHHQNYHFYATGMGRGSYGYKDGMIKAQISSEHTKINEI